MVSVQHRKSVVQVHNLRKYQTRKKPHSPTFCIEMVNFTKCARTKKRASQVLVSQHVLHQPVSAPRTSCERATFQGLYLFDPSVISPCLFIFTAFFIPTQGLLGLVALVRGACLLQLLSHGSSFHCRGHFHCSPTGVRRNRSLTVCSFADCCALL